MITNNIQDFLNKHHALHDSIITECNITNSVYVDDKGNIVYKKNNTNEIKLLISSQEGYQIEIRLIGVTEFRLQDFHELIIYQAVLKESDKKLLFSLTGGFNEKHIWFKCSDIDLEEKF